MRHVPNLLTGMRLALALFMFFALAAAAGDVPWFSDTLTLPMQQSLLRWAFGAFVVASVTDFFDGWLARHLKATTIWGAILDPIADKVLVCGAVLGLLCQGANAPVVLPAALILFREFTVSALREVAAGRAVKLPVTLLAKWKTTLQLVALGAELLVGAWAAFGLSQTSMLLTWASLFAHVTLWLAAVVTLITGAQYWEQARKALSED
ncbi:MAG TPA: CDP-diacylglycerol--glycerol-3-phosphate 3-phosphatidyltransferase [Caulobacteraceae bacterium]|nr:CDP-diacylglycerol--glycerol-3-phosphate 3-phosphatidyltransferase [Caulobacteraceae bacterium]